MKRILALSRSQMAAMKKDVLHLPNVAIVSINDPEKIPLFCQDDVNRSGGRLHVVVCHDSDPRDTDEPQFMTLDQARAIVQFIRQLPTEVDHLFVHCTAGMCRSGAVATFVFDWMGEMDWETFRNENPQISPNVWILKQLRLAYSEGLTDH